MAILNLCQVSVLQKCFQKKWRKVPDGVLGGYCRGTIMVRSIVLKTKPVRWFTQKKPEPKPSPIFLRVTDPTKKKPEKLHKNNVFSREDDPKT
jgi:hypothetical protein